MNQITLDTRINDDILTAAERHAAVNAAFRRLSLKTIVVTQIPRPDAFVTVLIVS